MSSVSRFRNFAFIVYEDSACENWQDLLSSLIIPCFISPYHDKDFNADGTSKKPHWHVMLMFDGKKSLEQVQEMIKDISTVPVEIVKSLRGYARYLCHLDNPEKAQYPVELVRSLGGADYPNAINLVIDKYISIKEMIAFCKEKSIRSYAQLLEYSSEERFDWFRVLCDNGTVVMKEYLKSLSWQENRGDPTQFVNFYKNDTIYSFQDLKQYFKQISSSDITAENKTAENKTAENKTAENKTAENKTAENE